MENGVPCEPERRCVGRQAVSKTIKARAATIYTLYHAHKDNSYDVKCNNWHSFHDLQVNRVEKC